MALNFINRQFIQYILVGTLVAIIYFAFYFFLLKNLNFDHTISSIISYIFTFPMSFWGHKTYTFKVKGNYLSQFILFTITVFSLLFFNHIFINFFRHDINENILVIISLVIIVIVRYFLLKIVFK